MCYWLYDECVRSYDLFNINVLREMQTKAPQKQLRCVFLGGVVRSGQGCKYFYYDIT